ncbi:MAG: hypothetical protein ACYCT9_09155 [Leptospirillum sp.]
MSEIPADKTALLSLISSDPERVADLSLVERILEQEVLIPSLRERIREQEILGRRTGGCSEGRMDTRPSSFSRRLSEYSCLASSRLLTRMRGEFLDRSGRDRTPTALRAPQGKA